MAKLEDIKNKTIAFLAAWLIFSLLVITLTMARYYSIDFHRARIKKEAIERGHAIHDSQTGQWRWKESGE